MVALNSRVIIEIFPPQFCAKTFPEKRPKVSAMDELRRAVNEEDSANECQEGTRR